MTKIKPQFAKPEETKLFVKDDGCAFPSGTIGKQLSAFFQNANVRTQRTAHTDVCKCYTTLALDNASPEECATVQYVMSHSKNTSERCYIRKQSTQRGSEGMAVLKEVTAVAAATTTSENRQWAYKGCRSGRGATFLGSSEPAVTTVTSSWTNFVFCRDNWSIWYTRPSGKCWKANKGCPSGRGGTFLGSSEPAITTVTSQDEETLSAAMTIDQSDKSGPVAKPVKPLSDKQKRTIDTVFADSIVPSEVHLQRTPRNYPQTRTSQACGWKT